MSATRLIEGAIDKVRATAGVKTVYGEPIKLDGKTIIPIAKVAFGGMGTAPEVGESAASELGGGRMRLRIIAVAGVLLLACSDPLAPFQPEITNVTDSFQFQATGIQNVTWSHEYVWQNTGTTANIDHSSTVTTGTATLTIRDAVGAQVYTNPLSPSGSVTTNAGTSGAWTIRVELVNLDGTLNFRVQKP